MTEIDSALQNLLAPLHGVAPVARRARKPKKMRRLLVAIALLVLCGVGVAAAAGFNPFSGIGSADRPTMPTDTLDDAVRASMDEWNAHAQSGGAGKLLPDSARLLTTLPSGRRVYAFSTTTTALCVLIEGTPGTGEGITSECGNPLSQSQPTTELIERTSSATKPFAVGVVRDDVASVSFIAEGVEKTVPISHNVWVWEGESNIPRSLTVNFRDGTTTTIGHG